MLLEKPGRRWKRQTDRADKGWRKMRHHSGRLELDRTHTSCGRTAVQRRGRSSRESGGAVTSGGKDETGLGGEVETQTPGSHYHIGLKGTAHT